MAPFPFVPMFAATRVIASLILPLALILAGCQPSWRTQFPKGSVLYDRTDHHRFGKIVGFEETHDFQNNTPPESAILIEQDSDHTIIWGACATCAATFDVKAQ